MYQDWPVVEIARACGIPIHERTSGHVEVEATCPFCGDHGPGKYHLSLNKLKNQYRCNLCGEAGNSLQLFARLRAGGDTKLAYGMLLGGETDVSAVCRHSPAAIPAEPEPSPLSYRHDVFYDLLDRLELTARHEHDLLQRGLSRQRIRENHYRSMPEDWRQRRKIAADLARSYDLRGIPGFYMQKDGAWSFTGKPGILIPFLTKDGYIQGMQIRVNDELLDTRDNGKKSGKYPWFSSRGMVNGTKSGSYLHVAGNIQSKTAYLTEGALKGDTASYLSNDSLFVCVPGISNIRPSLLETLTDLGVQEAVEAVDMDKRTNENVRRGLAKIRMVLAGMGIRHSVCDWNPALNGIDDYLLWQIQQDEQRQNAA